MRWLRSSDMMYVLYLSIVPHSLANPIQYLPRFYTSPITIGVDLPNDHDHGGRRLRIRGDEDLRPIGYCAVLAYTLIKIALA